MALGNLRDGGVVVLGVEQEGRGLNAIGLSAEQLTSWEPDYTRDALAAYIDPPADFDLTVLEYSGARCLVFEVREFQDIPHLCKRGSEGVLREGACYVRTRRKPESSEIPTHSEMRDLLDLAIEKGVRRFVVQANQAGLQIAVREANAPTDENRYATELGDLA
jgi:predicted HTH transcriptional regulator